MRRTGEKGLTNQKKKRGMQRKDRDGVVAPPATPETLRVYHSFHKTHMTSNIVYDSGQGTFLLLCGLRGSTGWGVVLAT